MYVPMYGHHGKAWGCGAASGYFQNYLNRNNGAIATVPDVFSVIHFFAKGKQRLKTLVGRQIMIVDSHFMCQLKQHLINNHQMHLNKCWIRVNFPAHMVANIRPR